MSDVNTALRTAEEAAIKAIHVAIAAGSINGGGRQPFVGERAFFKEDDI